MNNQASAIVISFKNNDSDNPEIQSKIETDTNINMNFGLNYLKMFTKASSLSQQVNLSLKKDFPIIVKYNLADLGVLRFYLAPRIIENEEN